MSTRIATDKNFESLLTLPGWVLWLFYLPGSTDGGIFSKPTRLAVDAFDNRITLVKVSIARCQEARKRHDMLGTGYWLYKDGVKVADQIGSFPYMRGPGKTEYVKRQIVDWLKRHMGE